MINTLYLLLLITIPQILLAFIIAMVQLFTDIKVWSEHGLPTLSGLFILFMHLMTLVATLYYLGVCD